MVGLGLFFLVYESEGVYCIVRLDIGRFVGKVDGGEEGGC